MRVIVCAAYGGPYRGSFVPMLEAIADEARRRGHPTTFVLWDSARGRAWVPDLAARAEVRYVRSQGSRATATWNAMRELDGALGGDAGVIHTHFSSFDVPAALMRLRRRRLGIFWHDHGPLFDDRYHRLRNSIRYGSLGHLVDGILCVSPELAAELRSRHAPAGRLHAFPNAIDTSVFSPVGATERDAARAALGIPAGARVVLHFGWAWELKGGDLMAAAADLLADDPGILFLTVLGATVDPAVVAGHGNVRALTPADDVRQLYAACDVFLGCSRFEGGLPLAALEALACGRPLVLTDIPVQARAVRELPGAAVVPAAPAEIAAGIRRMLALSDTDRTTNQTVARERLAESFSLGAWARRLVDLYESAVADR